MSRILIIEDEQVLRYTLVQLLELKGYEVISCVNGEEGVKRIIETLPDIVISDVSMPRMDGFQVLEMIQNLMEESLVPPFIFLTAKVEHSDVRKGMRLGAEDYITKPFSNKELFEVLELRLKKIKNLKEGILKSERERIADELHNDLQQLLVGAYLGFEAIGSTTNMPEKDKSVFENSLSYLAKGIKKSRSVSQELLQPVYEKKGLKEVLLDLARPLTNSGKIEFTYTYTSNLNPKEGTCYLIQNVMSELFNNIMKHSQASKVDLNVCDTNNNALIIELVDNGKGFNLTEKSSGIGLRRLREKIENSNGRFEITTTPGGGTSSKITLPVL